MPRKTLPFRTYAQILIFSALVVLGGGILWFVQQAVHAGIIGVRDGLITRLETQINRKIRYSSISPSFFGSFDVRNVRIMDNNEHPVLTVSRFRVAYSLMDLLRGKTQAIRSVRLDSPLVDFDTARDSDLLKLFDGARSAGGGEGSIQGFAAGLPDKLLVRIRQGKCLIAHGSEQFDLDALNLNIEIIDDRMIFNGWWNIGFAFAKPIGEPLNVQTAMRANGFFRMNMEEGEAVFSVPSISGDIVSVAPVSFGLALQDGAVNVWKMSDRLPYNFVFEYRLAEGDFAAQLDCANFKLGDFISFSGGLANAGQLLGIAGSGMLYFERRQDGSLVYAVEMSGTSPAPALPAAGVFGRPAASFAISAEGTERQVSIDTLRFSLPSTGAGDSFFYGNLDFAGDIGLTPLAPGGVLVLDNFSLTGTQSVNARITVNTYEGEETREIRALCENMGIGQLDLRSFSVLLRPQEDAMGFTVSARNSGAPGEFSLNGSTGPGNTELRLNVDSFSAGDIFMMLLPFVRNASVPASFQGLLDGTSVTTSVFFASGSDGVQFSAPDFSLNGKNFSGRASVFGTDRRFALTGGRFARGDELLLVSGRAELAEPGNFGFSLNAGYRDLAYAIEGVIQGGSSISIQGPYGLNVSLVNSRMGYSGFMRAEGFPLPFLGDPGGGLARLSCAAQFQYDARAAWSTNLELLEILGMGTPAGPAQMRVSGRINNHGANLTQLYYSDSLGPLNGSANVTWTEDFSVFEGTASLAEGAERYRMDAAYSGGRLDAALSGASMQMDRMIGLSGNTLADGDIRLFWERFGPFRAEMNLASVRGRAAKQEFQGSARAVLDNEAFTVNALRFQLAHFEGTAQQFTFNRANGTAGTNIVIQGFAGDKRLESDITLDAHFEPVRSWSDMNRMFDAFSGAIHVNNLVYGREAEPQSFDIVFSRDAGSGGKGGAFSVTGGPRNMFRLQMDRDGNFFAGLSNPFPVRGSVIGRVKNKMIDAHCGDLYVDLAGVFNLLPTVKDIYLTGGYVNATLDIRGSITDPEFFGTARGTSVRIKIPAFLPQELRPIPFNVAIEGNEARFGPVATAVGGGAGSVDGWFLFDRWIPNTFNLDIQVPRETPIPYGLDITGFIARGEAYGNLAISMENLAMDFSGDLFVNHTELGVNAEEIGRNQDSFDTANPYSVNITVNTGPVVEFLYPSSNFPILRANPDIGTKVHITADSLTRQFSITSDVRIRSGEIFYFERSFYIRSGSLTFRENELHFSPRLTARAEVRERTEDGPVTISMIVDNAPLLSFTARFESNPLLSQMEIYALLGFNMTGTQYDENSNDVQRDFWASSTDFLAQLFVVRQMEQRIRNFTRLDMFSIRTQALQNFILNQTGGSQTPVDRNVGLGNYFDNTTVFGGKYVGQDMFVQGMLSMRYDANNENFGGLTLRPDIGVELQNPLFSIRWDFFPTHPENWYVNDNSITITRSWSF